ncbi:hypothetical protein AB0M54_29865 [Actinoplanes sp. NPDC051470]|uniref:hypothetical protein n=1 Tax=unclassified Actinoplanes TaxID=2626549 RepID=UPI003444305A
MNFTGIVEVVFALLALVLWGFVLMVALAVSRPALSSGIGVLLIGTVVALVIQHRRHRRPAA